MEIENLQEKLSRILNSEDVILELYLISKDKNIRFANISDDGMKSLLELFKQEINSLFLENEYRLESIDRINDEAANTYYYFDSDNIYEKLEHLIEFTGDDIENFSFDEMNFSDISTFLIKIATEDEDFLLYKKNYPINLLRRGKTLFFRKSNENIDEVKDDILKIDKSFQFLIIDNHILVLNLKMLERDLGYENIIMKKAEEVLLKIKAIDFIDDISKIEEIIKSKNKKIAKKLNLIKDSPVMDIVNTEPSKVIDFIQKHPELKKTFKFDSDGKLEFKSIASVERFLKLLDDDYLQSEITELFYDSVNKYTIKSD